MLSRGFSFGSGHAAGASVFNPATLSLTGWWLTTYGGSPWVGTASAGSSGSNDLTDAFAAPSTHASGGADFDGSNDNMEADGTLDDYVNAGASGGWALVNVDAIATDDAAGYPNDAIISTDTSAYYGIFLRSSGTVVFYLWDGGDKSVSDTFATGSYKLVQWKHDGSNMKIRVNGGSWQSQAAGNISDLTNTLRVGANRTPDAFLNGRIMDLGLTDSALSDANFDNIRSYCNSRYASLGVSV